MTSFVLFHVHSKASWKSESKTRYTYCATTWGRRTVPAAGACQGRSLPHRRFTTTQRRRRRRHIPSILRIIRYSIIRTPLSIFRIIRSRICSIIRTCIIPPPPPLLLKVLRTALRPGRPLSGWVWAFRRPRLVFRHRPCNFQAATIAW